MKRQIKELMHWDRDPSSWRVDGVLFQGELQQVQVSVWVCGGCRERLGFQEQYQAVSFAEQQRDFHRHSWMLELAAVHFQTFLLFPCISLSCRSAGSSLSWLPVAQNRIEGVIHSRAVSWPATERGYEQCSVLSLSPIDVLLQKGEGFFPLGITDISRVAGSNSAAKSLGTSVQF